MAKIEPYRMNPTAPTVALLMPDGAALDEHGAVHELELLPKGTRTFGSWDQVEELLRAGVGEAYCWDREPIRWRRHPRDDGPIGWTRRHNDVTVLRVAFPDEPERQLAGLAAWRDWLRSYGAAPQGSLGSSAMSLLRATIRRPLWTAGGELPPVRWTLGGRQELAAPPMSSHRDARHFDLPAAYASTLGALRYGGVWREVLSPDDPGRWAQEGRPVFAHAEVTVPVIRFGPVPRRPRRRPVAWDRCELFQAPGVSYPVGARLRGVWTWDELSEAQRAGSRVVVDRLWVHVVSGGELGTPFAPWWRAVVEGRAMAGFAGLLAKASANALWGQFCISEGRRELRDGSGRVRVLPAPGGGMPRSWDLAELITGRVRARLARMMRLVDRDVLSVHTDGGWTTSAGDVPDGWLVKDEASRLDLVGPQMLRYRRQGSGRWLHCCSGIPPGQADRYFAERWTGAA